MHTYFKVTLLLSIIFSANVFCQSFDYSIDSPEIINALEKAGDNRVEIQKILDHYKNDSDSLKQKAALYIIANIQFHHIMYHHYQIDTNLN